ncbi:MAG: CheY-P-specific phosphatase CheC [Firmicutes bacterium HGW-Firmicutes-15]|nr:MAG: CheY-P-specific phosphatase CheC [Firmicutes bacterium HGW-Firmicutes-15]
MVEDFDKLSILQLDALMEIANIGAGNAATALAKLINARIDMSVPRIDIKSFAQVPDLMGGADVPVVGLYLKVSGDAPASILFILAIERAAALVDLLMGRENGTTNHEGFSDMDVSALMEVGNILSATYLGALTIFTDLKFYPSVPAIGMDMAGALLNAILAQLGEVADQVLVLKTELKRDGQGVVGDFFLLPDPGSLEIILGALGVGELE